MVASWINFITQLKTLEMKKNYTIILVLFALVLTFNSRAQMVLLDDNFETGYTDGTEIQTTDATWFIVGVDFTFPAKNATSSGADSSDWYARLEQGGSAQYAHVEKNFTLEAGETYEFKAWVLPDVSGQKNAYTLQVLDGATVKVESAKPATGNVWEELSTSYVAEESKDYRFRLRKNWGANGGSFDNVSIVCTTCATASISENDAFEFGVFPNPVENVLSIQTEEELTSVEIVNLIGQSIQVLQSNVKNIDVSSLAPGVYVVKLTSLNGGVSLKKIIKN